MNIFTINNKREEKFLRKKTADFDFSNVSKKEIADLIKKMREIMKKEIGIGLSANQIGLDMRLFVAEIPQHDKTFKFFSVFNPNIIKTSKETSVLEEGCLSAPGFYGEVKRLNKITLEGYDKNGRKIKIKAQGLTARVFQHEIDHLNGILFIDKAVNLRKITKLSDLKSQETI
ncbi:MAG: peptide deformylase [Patescibacteria group bacterium]|nr:peptide deformylase [Patescibacteria group bacterium]